jgi:hypothetical protein
VSRSRGAPGHCVCMCPVDNDDSEKKQQCCDTLRSIQRRCGHWASGRCPRECSMRILHTYTQTTTSERSAKHPSWYSVAVIRPSLITLSHQFFYFYKLWICCVLLPNENVPFFGRLNVNKFGRSLCVALRNENAANTNIWYIIWRIAHFRSHVLL